jgi:hypothetical protein
VCCWSLTAAVSGGVASLTAPMLVLQAVGDAFLDQFAALAASGSAEAMSGLYVRLAVCDDR